MYLEYTLRHIFEYTVGKISNYQLIEITGAPCLNYYFHAFLLHERYR